MKSSIFLISMLLLSVPIAAAPANAFSLFGIDFDKIWNSVTSLYTDDKNSTKTTQETKKVNSSSNTKTTTPKSPNIRTETSVELAGTTYSESQIKNSIYSNDNLQEYIKGFGYECIFIKTDQGKEFTVFFDTANGQMKSLKKGESCDRKIYLEESLITDLQQEGFQATKIKTYLQKVDLPASMYFKAVKVAAIG